MLLSRALTVIPAFYSPSLNIQKLYKIDHNASIFTGEALALYSAIQFIYEQKIIPVTIFSDSKNVLEALSSPILLKDYSYIIPLIKDKLRAAENLQIQIIIVWIPVHTGILDNETVDLLAKNAITSGSYFNSLIPHTDFYTHLKGTLLKNHQNLLHSQSNFKGKQYFRFFSKPLKPWFKNIKTDRKEIVTISRIRSNHYNLNSSLFRCNLVQSPACDCGYPTQDINHIIWECPILLSYRPSLLSSIQNNLNLDPPSTFSSCSKNPLSKLFYL